MTAEGIRHATVIGSGRDKIVRESRTFFDAPGFNEIHHLAG